MKRDRRILALVLDRVCSELLVLGKTVIRYTHQGIDVFNKGIDVISTMVRYVQMGGKHFDRLRDDYTAFDLQHDPKWR